MDARGPLAVLDTSVLVPRWSRIVLQRLAEAQRFRPVLPRAADVAARYPLDLALPGGAVDLLDSAAHLAAERHTPAALQQVRIQVQQMRAEKEEFIERQQYEQAAEARDHEATLLARADWLREEWIRQAGSDRVPVAAAGLVAALEARAVEPLPAVVPALVEHRARAEAAIAARLGGASSTNGGQGDSRCPLAVLVVGEAARGAMEIGAQLARDVFGEDASPLVVDLAAFGGPDAAGRLFGVPPGQEGFDEGGTLSEAVRLRPERLVILYDLDRAHQSVHSTLREIVAGGRMHDARGRSIDFRYAVLVFVSRLPTREALQARVGTLPDVAWVMTHLAGAPDPDG